ncbi:Histidine phosphatase superfamily (branch 1) [Clostridium acidisoli DSM 12555]|uniref:Histidine phosphatase superfamily (Branch 1) n=1 Tax=Clostridium acidisoli DSM 12555 TaxID=1121291 RepID=A0A1W1X7G8_9CLOT|nr:histidine phosphatase family protein [Clostridium acidisoli]SMC19773.1 Histidine phosphatase superfamily (branch 1) [Clostridium acidisoli DSM 12555]
MKIGLIRHFEVIQSSKALTLMSSEEFKQWQNRYNVAMTRSNAIDIDKKEWQICYTSDLSRAVYTAKTVFGDKIIETKLLREVEILPLFDTNIKIPFIIWNTLGRFQWYFSRKHIDEKRANDFISDILNKYEKNILIVSHGALMWYLRKSLISKGFNGPRFGKAKNGHLYIFKC